MIVSPTFSKLSTLSKLRQREVILPTMRVKAIVTPLVVGDDITIRSSIMSPDAYDKKICELMYKHIEFDGIDKMPFKDFLNQITVADKQVILWGILNSTYRNVEDTVICEYCKEKLNVSIPYDDLLQEDSITIWEEPLPPSDFVKTCSIEIGTPDISRLEIDLGLLPISYRLAILSMITVDKIRENFNTLGTILSLPEQLASVTKEIRIISEGAQPYRILNTQEIHIAYNKYLTYDIMERIRDEYTYFDKYIPKFYTYFTCQYCSGNIKYELDMEVNLFRNYFRGLGLRE